MVSLFLAMTSLHPTLTISGRRLAGKDSNARKRAGGPRNDPAPEFRNLRWVQEPIADQR